MDVVKGLWESTRGQCSGDAGLDDAKLSELYSEYQEQLAKASKLGLDERSVPFLLETDLNEMTNVLRTDLSFLHSGNLLICDVSVSMFSSNHVLLFSELQKANTAYEETQCSGKAQEKTMWNCYGMWMNPNSFTRRVINCLQRLWLL